MQQKLQLKLQKFLTTPAGSFIKCFIAVMITLFIAKLKQGVNLFALDLNSIKDIIGGGLAASLPVIVNWINPSYPIYGVGSPEETLKS